MEAGAATKRLNRAVALSVVALSVAMGLGNIKDGNIVQAMQQAQSDAVDRWGEYQATRTKQHLVETAATSLHAMAGARAKATLAAYDAEGRRYRVEAPRLARAAQAQTALYDALNVHDDQFDAAEALISTAISLAGVAALAESGWLLAVAWGFGAFGLFMTVCGFAGWSFHPDILSRFLG